MRCVYRIAAVLMLALLVPLTSHSLLEHWEVIHQTAASGDAHDDHHDAADGTCRVESFDSPLSKFEQVQIPFAFIPFHCAFLENPKAQHSFDFRVNPSPPGLAVGWQFISRTALSPRAPSIS
ncbi:MAG: hypothetical protein ABI042_07615 [Verrucomicrobiota bacterium]